MPIAHGVLTPAATTTELSQRKTSVFGTRPSPEGMLTPASHFAFGLRM